jgi:uncharacterized protein YraI
MILIRPKMAKTYQHDEENAIMPQHDNQNDNQPMRLTRFNTHATPTLRRPRWQSHGLWMLLALMLVSFGGFVYPAQAQGYKAVVVNEYANIRLTPALGAEVLGTVEAGHEFNTITARSGDGEWLRVIYAGQEGWVNLAPIVILQGDINALPVADPRSIPYGGFEAPRSGQSDQIGSVAARATDGLRVRSGPSRAYPTLANINFNQGFTITGRNGATTWYQVNFEGTLGWVSGAFVEILSGDVFATPVDGIVASSPPLTGESDDDYIGLLRFMLDRLNIAQESLNVIKEYWTTAALNGRAFCQAYPARPSDFPIASPMLAANYATLFPLQQDFNVAMANVRLAIDLFIQVCNQPGTGNPVGTATVQGALDTVNLADGQFNELRGRIESLLPDISGEGQCLLRYNGRVEVLPIVSPTTIYLDTLSARSFTTGYCFDGIEGQILRFEALPVPPGNLALFISVSALDTPDNFLVVGRGGSGQALNVGPLTLTRTTRYVVLLADLGDDGRTEPAQGDYAFRISDNTFGNTTGTLFYDETTASVQINIAETVEGGTTQTGDGESGEGTTTVEQVGGTCPFTENLSSISCSSLFDCGEAQACFQSGATQLDATDGTPGDGIPCSPLLCTAPN